MSRWFRLHIIEVYDKWTAYRTHEVRLLLSLIVYFKHDNYSISEHITVSHVYISCFACTVVHQRERKPENSTDGETPRRQFLSTISDRLFTQDYIGHSNRFRLWASRNSAPLSSSAHIGFTCRGVAHASGRSRNCRERSLSRRRNNTGRLPCERRTLSPIGGAGGDECFSGITPDDVDRRIDRDEDGCFSKCASRKGMRHHFTSRAARLNRTRHRDEVECTTRCTIIRNILYTR